MNPANHAAGFAASFLLAVVVSWFLFQQWPVDMPLRLGGLSSEDLRTIAFVLLTLPILVLVPPLFYVIEALPVKFCQGCGRSDVGYERPDDKYCSDCHKKERGVEVDGVPMVMKVRWGHVAVALLVVAVALSLLLIVGLDVDTSMYVRVFLSTAAFTFAAGVVLVVAVAIIDGKFWHWLFRRIRR